MDRPVPAWPPSNTSCGDSDRRGNPPDAVDLAQRLEAIQPAGQQLVSVGLVPGVPDDPVARRFHQPVERQRDLDDAQRRSQVATRHGNRADDRLADLGRELDQLRLGQAAKLRGTLEAVEDGHRVGLLLLGDDAVLDGRRTMRVMHPADSCRHATDGPGDLFDI